PFVVALSGSPCAGAGVDRHCRPAGLNQGADSGRARPGIPSAYPTHPGPVPPTESRRRSFSIGPSPRARSGPARVLATRPVFFAPPAPPSIALRRRGRPVPPTGTRAKWPCGAKGGAQSYLEGHAGHDRPWRKPPRFRLVAVPPRHHPAPNGGPPGVASLFLFLFQFAELSKVGHQVLRRPTGT